MHIHVENKVHIPNDKFTQVHLGESYILELRFHINIKLHITYNDLELFKNERSKN